MRNSVKHTDVIITALTLNGIFFKCLYKHRMLAFCISAVLLPQSPEVKWTHSERNGNAERKCFISSKFCQMQSVVGVMLQVTDGWTNHPYTPSPSSPPVVVEEFNRSSKSVISTIAAWSEELLELLIELGMLEYTHPRTNTHRCTTCPGPNTCFSVPAIYSEAWCIAAGWQHGCCVQCFTPCRLSFTSQRAGRHSLSPWHRDTCT